MPSCCGLGVGHPLTSLANLALGRQQCQLLMQAAIITAMTTPLTEASMQTDDNITITQPFYIGQSFMLLNIMTSSPLCANR